jgi:hypothetical protein
MRIILPPPEQDLFLLSFMDYCSQEEVHQVLGKIHGEFEKLAEDWRISDRSEDAS